MKLATTKEEKIVSRRVLRTRNFCYTRYRQKVMIYLGAV